MIYLVVFLLVVLGLLVGCLFMLVNLLDKKVDCVYRILKYELELHNLDKH